MPQLMPLEDARKFRKLTEGSLGEFDISALLRQFGDDREGRAAASHWRGGSFRLYENKEGKYPVLSHVVEWDSTESAHAYYQLYQKAMRGKWKNMQVTSSTEIEIRGTGDSGRFVLRLSGDTVQATEGLR